MALIQIWGWRLEPDTKISRFANETALDAMSLKYLEHFPNEHVETVLGLPHSSADRDPSVEILVTCSFDIALLDQARAERVKQDLIAIYESIFPGLAGMVTVTLG